MGMLSLMIVESDPDIQRMFQENFSRNGNRIFQAENGQKALELFQRYSIDVVVAATELPDGDGLGLMELIKDRLPQTPVILMAGNGTIPQATEAMKKGAFDYLLKPLSLETIEKIIREACEGRPEAEPTGLNPPSSAVRLNRKPILTQDKRLLGLMDLCRRVAPSKATVLLQGESGTGKELFARYLHAHSNRNQGAFVAVNCAALPENLLESELFGHEKGAFTGALQKKLGKFELAHRGTILLDEISEMNPALQAKILRVLQEGEVDRIGGRQPVPIDVRVVATTNRDLEQCVAKGDFREDLYYRLNVVPIKIPPLRERREDIGLLAESFLRRFAESYQKPVGGLSEEALSWLKRQEWRGNVRELENLIERMVLISMEPFLTLQSFCPEPVAESPARVQESIFPCTLREVEKDLIFKALGETNGNRTHAAKMLGISVRTLRNKLHEYQEGLSFLEAEGTV